MYRNTFFTNKVVPKPGFVRCHLVLENITLTKKCTPIKPERGVSGLTVGQFKVFLATLAQFHAVGVAWEAALFPESNGFRHPTEKFPFLKKENSTRQDLHLLNMYESLLKWVFKGKKTREILLFQELRKLYGTEPESSEKLMGVCLGTILPSEIMFQSPTDESNPVCGAVTCLHRVHFGHLLREVATLFYVLPTPLVRSSYLVFMLQNYCHVLTLTMEMLSLDWHTRFDRMSFQNVLTVFMEQIPHAILAAVVTCMKQTDPNELEALVSGKTYVRQHHPRFANNHIPLTPSRVDFLVKLMEKIHKPV